MAEAQPQSIADRIAALKLNQVNGGAPPSYDAATKAGAGSARSRPPPPPPPPRPALPARPSANGRSTASSVPPSTDRVSDRGIANLPEAQPPPNVTANGMDGISRPALPPRTSTQSSQGPSLPPRRPSGSPALPPRRPSEATSTSSRRPSEYGLSRRGSDESISSVNTARSAVSAVSNGTTATSQSDRFSVRAPSYDPSALPALPPKRTEEEKLADYKKYNQKTTSKRPIIKTKSTPNVLQKQVGTTPPPPRPTAMHTSTLPAASETIHEETTPSPARIEPPPRQRTLPPPPRKSALSMGLDQPTTNPPSVPTRPGSVPATNSNGAPPPIPTSSRPDLASLQASKPKMNGNSAPAQAPAAAENSCLICRDFSGPDNHAARFPRESLPSQDLGWVAQQLTSPFHSPTDKARALFTWLHHNIAYDTVAFFGNNVKPSTPQSTLQTGLAVCEGYAGLFAAMAMKVGLESYVISGHGKGYGFSTLKPGDPIPPYNAGHAWNVVKIDGGQWKLIDCCWGAGNVTGTSTSYNKHFSPERFTQSNDDFGLDHFPGDSGNQFRNDGRTISWEEYVTGGKKGSAGNFCSIFTGEEGLLASSFKPAENPIVLSAQYGPTVRFSFQKRCPHWDPVRNGKGPWYLYLLQLGGDSASDGAGAKRYVPLETNGEVWWCDVPVQDLGRPGQSAKIWALTTLNGQDARGYTKAQWYNRQGGWSFASVCGWDLA